MALSGVRGPFKGAYFVINAGPVDGVVTTPTTNAEIFEWTCPAHLSITNVQGYCSTAGAPAGTFDVLRATTSILTGAATFVLTSSVTGTLSTATGVECSSGSVLRFVYTFQGTTSVAPGNFIITAMGYFRDHPASVRSGTDYRGSGLDSA